MYKLSSKFKIFISIFLCTTLLLSSVVTNGSSTSSGTIKDSYNALTNIQKQLNSINKNAYVNIVNGDSNEILKNQIDIFSSQLNSIKKDLTSLSSQELSPSEERQVQTLLTVNSYLLYAKEQIRSLLNTSSAEEQYVFFINIVVANSLINQLFSYNDLT